MMLFEMFNPVRFVTLVVILTALIKANNGQGGATASSTYVNVGCFSGDSSVVLRNGEQKQIGDLKTGDKIRSIDQLEIVDSEMFLMLDKQPSKQARFYTFDTASGHRISLTGLHLIPIVYSNQTIDYIPARHVQLGDRFYVRINEQIEFSSVINITIEIKRGYFAPLTMTGTVLVNNIYASCFASVKSHEFAQMFMAPFRWYYQLTRFISILEPFDNNRSDGIHWLLEIIYQFVNYIQPSVLRHS